MESKSLACVSLKYAVYILICIWIEEFTCNYTACSIAKGIVKLVCNSWFPKTPWLPVTDLFTNILEINWKCSYSTTVLVFLVMCVCACKSVGQRLQYPAYTATTNKYPGHYVVTRQKHLLINATPVFGKQKVEDKNLFLLHHTYLVFVALFA